MVHENGLVETKRQIDLAAKSLSQRGSGSIANLECRLADLQEKFVATRAVTLTDVVARLEAIREIVATLGEPGYLFHLVEATLRDVRALAANASRE